MFVPITDDQKEVIDLNQVVANGRIARWQWCDVLGTRHPLELVCAPIHCSADNAWQAIEIGGQIWRQRSAVAGVNAQGTVAQMQVFVPRPRLTVRPDPIDESRVSR